MAKLKEFRPALAAFLLMMAMALTTTALSFFVGPVCDELSIGRGSFTIYYSLMTASGAFSIPFLGQVINKKGVRGILTVSAFWVAAGLLGFSFCGSLWMFFGCAVFLGIFGTSCVNLCANVIVQQAYSGGKASSLLGLVMSGSGVGGMILSQLMPGLLRSFGWRIGYRILAVCWLGLILVSLFCQGRGSTAVSIGQRITAPEGVTKAEALRSPRLYLLFVVMFILSAACGIQQHIPSVLEEFGHDPAAIGTMMSCFTASLAVGKILQGALYSRPGLARSSCMMIALYGLSYILLATRFALPGLILLAVGMGTVTTMMPTVTRFSFGAREYASIWSMLATTSSIATLIASPLFGMVYDATGSYEPAMTASAALLLVALAALFLSLRTAK